jgi:predicted dehydrogenase
MRPELVCICTMPNTHRDVALRAIGAGAHVLCEKPFAMNLAEAREIVAAAERNGRLLTVGFNMRFMAAAEHAAAAVERGEIGVPTLAIGSLECGVPRWGSHLVKAIAGGGILATSGVHMIDVVRWVCGRPRPIAARAFATIWYPADQISQATVPDAITTWDGENFVDASISFSERLEFLMRADARLDRAGVTYRFEVRGDEGLIEFDPFSSSYAHREAGTRPTIDGVMQESVDREVADVVSAIETGSAPRVTSDDALIVQAVVDALYESAETHHEQAVEAAVPTDAMQ